MSFHVVVPPMRSGHVDYSLVLSLLWTKQAGAGERTCSRLGLEVADGLGEVKTGDWADVQDAPPGLILE